MTSYRVMDGAASPDGKPAGGDDPYARGWKDCAEALASSYEAKTARLLASRRGLLDRLLLPAVARVYRDAADIARETPPRPDPAAGWFSAGGAFRRVPPGGGELAWGPLAPPGS